jgi:preprotein translocase subunit SecE
MRGAILPHSQYASMAWCSVKAQGQLCLTLLYFGSYEGLSKIFWTGRLQMVQLSVTRFCCIAILLVLPPWPFVLLLNPCLFCLFRYRLSPETFGYTFILSENNTKNLFCHEISILWSSTVPSGVFCELTGASGLQVGTSLFTVFSFVSHLSLFLTWIDTCVLKWVWWICRTPETMPFSVSFHVDKMRSYWFHIQCCNRTRNNTGNLK